MKLEAKKIIVVIIFIGVGIAVFGDIVGFVSAAGTSDGSYVPLAKLPGTTNSNGTLSLNTYIPGIFNLAVGIAAVLAVLMIIIGGVEYMTTDAISGKAEGKARINNALWGLLLVLVSYILLHTINPKLTVFDLNIKPVDTTKGVPTNIIDPLNNSYINTGVSATKLEQSSVSSVNSAFMQPIQ